MDAESSCDELLKTLDEALEMVESKCDFNQDPDDDDFLAPEPTPLKKHPFQCEICDKILQTKQSLKLHALTHVDPTSRKINRCEICEATFKSVAGLKYHLQTKHTAGKEREKLPCPTCGRIFKSAEGRKIHMTIQHGAGGPIFKCKECPMVFARKPHLDLHMTTHGSGLHVCTICGKPYARMKDLSRHETYCGVKELCCSVCGKQFRKEQVLENHQKKCRPGSRNFCCLTCGQGFVTEQALKTHEAIHRRTFRCVECPQTFVTVLALRNHEQTMHWEKLGCEPSVDERRGRPKQKKVSKEEAKVRMRRSKYDLFIGLEHLADPSTLIEEEKPVKEELKSVDSTAKRIPCEHCPLKFASKKALQNHGQRRHWEKLGLAEPAPESRGRKRKRPLERVSRRIRRPRKKVNYIELVDLPEEFERDAKKEKVDQIKSEDATHGEPPIDGPVENVVIPKSVICAEETNVPIEEIEEFDIFAKNEVIIKEEIIEFEDYELDYFENDLADGDVSVDELTFGNIVVDLEVPQEPASDEVDTLDVEPALETNVSEEPHIFKELVIRLDKLDYSTLAKPGSNKKPLPRKECEHCGKQFTQQYRLAQHRVREHGSTETPTKTKLPPKTTLPPSYHCEKCDKSYHIEYNFKLHNEKVHGIAIEGESTPYSPYSRTCKHCGQKLNSWPSLVRHTKSFHGETIDETKFAQCPSCRTRFLTEEDMKEHVCLKSFDRVRKPKQQSFNCNLCHKAYSSLLYLECHYPVHPEYHNFTCDQCPKAFFKESAMERHKNYVHASRPKKMRPFKSKYKNPFPRSECEHCGQTFAYRYRLALHRVKEHGSTETPVANRDAPKTTLPRNFHCDQCDKSYHLEVNLATHKAKVHGIGEVPLKETTVLKHTCKHCKKQFTGWGALVYHRKFIHGETVDKAQFVQCPSCRLKFTSDEEMAEHLCLKGVIRRTERPFKCDLCDKAYLARSHLEGHYSVHPEYHNAKCDQCPRGFFSEIWLNKHKKKFHLPKELYYACETCNQLFKTQQNLKRHQELHSDREYCCEHCGKKFKMRINLRSHMYNVHAEYVSDAARAARAIPCTVCGKTLRGLSAFKAHMRSHNNDRRFKCPFPSCGRTFLTNSCLKVHVQSHTKDYKFKCKFCEYGTVIRKRIQLHEQREHNHNRFAEVNDS